MSEADGASPGERLRQARNELGISQAKMAGEVGLAQSTLADYERGHRPPPVSTLLALEYRFRVNHEWVLEGKGRPLKTDMSTRPVVVTGEDELEALHRLEGRDKYYAVPYLADAAAAGQGLVMEEDIEGYCLVHARVAGQPEALRCVRIEGDSMEPGLTDGSIVAVDTRVKELEKVRGKIVCARTGEDGVVIKRLRVREPYLLLYSDHPDQEKYSPIVVDLREVEDPLIGQVVWAWVDLR